MPGPRPGEPAGDGAGDFFDRVHQPLHELATAAAYADRAATAELLKGKQGVERDLADSPELPSGGVDLTMAGVVVWVLAELVRDLAHRGLVGVLPGLVN